MAWYTGFLIVSQTKDIMADTHWLTNAYLWFGMPYLAHDIWAMYQTFYWREGYNIPCSFPYETVTHFMRRSWIMILHHVSLAVLFFPVLVFLRGNRGDFFVGCSYMMEISVPFVSVATTLDQLQMKNTRAYLVNGLLMLFAFFCGRILLFPYLYWCYALHAGMGILEVPFSIPIKCNVGCFIALLPQVYWFWSMLRKAVKYLKKNN